jgi:hypothetical protein
MWVIESITGRLLYDNLFVLTSTKGKADLIQARYGAPTPGTDCK